MAFYRTFAKENEIIRQRYFPDKTSLFEEDFSMYPETFDIEVEREIPSLDVVRARLARA